jgi:tRNA(Ile2) C34 agmatinyltransferase TiaS
MKRCPRCGRQLISHIKTPTYRCELCRVTYASDDGVREAAERMVEAHRKTLERLAE